MRSALLLLCAALLGFAPGAAMAADAAALTEAQKAAVEDVVRELLTKKEPDIIIKAAQELQKKEEAESATKAEKALESYKDQVFKDPHAPVGGNLKGDVTVVEFFDYQCHYCKLALTAVEKLLKEDKNLKIIYKEYPVLGPDSVEAAKISLAAAKQGKFSEMHQALLTTKEHLSGDGLMEVAKKAGLDTAKLKKDMASEEFAKWIEENQKVGMEIGARGTPTFVIGSKVYPGALPYEKLKSLVEEARKAEKK